MFQLFKNPYIVLFLIALASQAVCQEIQSNRTVDAGVEFRAYPTGYIPGVRLDWGIGANSVLNFNLGYNVVRHRDQGEHEDERGGGFGFGFGYRYIFNNTHTGFFIGAHNDFWFNKIDWKDNVDQADELNGTSNIIVLQPILESGYTFGINENKWIITPSLSFGVEINVVENGDAVGEGFILLGGIALAYRF